MIRYLLLNGWRPSRLAVDARLPLGRLGQGLEHVLTRYAIGASNDGSQALYVVWILGQAMIDTVGVNGSGRPFEL